jgi:hypothetical protein
LAQALQASYQRNLEIGIEIKVITFLVLAFCFSFPLQSIARLNKMIHINKSSFLRSYPSLLLANSCAMSDPAWLDLLEWLEEKGFDRATMKVELQDSPAGGVHKATIPYTLLSIVL